MGLFGNFGAKVAKVFGAAKSVFGANKPLHRPFREEEKAATHAAGQAKRREAELKRRGSKQKTYDQAEIRPGDVSARESPYIKDFLDGYPFSRFASSNVFRLQYDRTQDHLYIQFMGGKGSKRAGPGRWYQYKQITLSEAKTVYNAASKGLWTWDFLRVRGSQTGHKKPFVKDSPPPGYLPLGRKRSNVMESP